MEVTANQTPARVIVETYLAAFAAGRVDEIVSLLADDVCGISTANQASRQLDYCRGLSRFGAG